jgi:hypothetical protein
MRKTPLHLGLASANGAKPKAGNEGTVSASGGPQPTSTPAAAIARGLLAGALGTATMDALLYGRYRRDGGESDAADWEFSAGLTNWDQAPAPAHVGKRLVEGLFDVELPPTRARVVNNVTHWAFGIVNGAQYGIVAGSLKRPRIGYGLLFGATVWAAGYVVLPTAKLYKPIWEYDANTLAKDLSAHLVYGLATATALRALSR